MNFMMTDTLNTLTFHDLNVFSLVNSFYRVLKTKSAFNFSLETKGIIADGTCAITKKCIDV